jgi:hypothetical protein
MLESLTGCFIFYVLRFTLYVLLSHQAVNFVADLRQSLVDAEEQDQYFAVDPGNERPEN